MLERDGVMQWMHGGMVHRSVLNMDAVYEEEMDDETNGKKRKRRSAPATLRELCVQYYDQTLGGVVAALQAVSNGLFVVSDMLQKLVETFWAFPPILLAIAVVALFGQTLTNLILALTLQRWIPYARLCRAQALTLRSREFVSASKVMGGGTLWILRRHIVPNLLASAVVIATFSMASAIIAEASLSFLGLGVPPETPTWGGMLADGRSYITRAWWLAVFPGLGIFITVLGLNYLGDWLRDQFDPKDELNLV